jgi:hypothetical protein
MFKKQKTHWSFGQWVFKLFRFLLILRTEPPAGLCGGLEVEPEGGGFSSGRSVNLKRVNVKAERAERDIRPFQDHLSFLGEWSNFI